MDEVMKLEPTVIQLRKMFHRRINFGTDYISNDTILIYHSYSDSIHSLSLKKEKKMVIYRNTSLSVTQISSYFFKQRDSS